MKVKQTTLNQFSEIYSHPSASLFRAVELKTLYEGCKDYDFSGPSLDLGCGDGTIANVLFDMPFTYGVDNGEAGDIQDAIDKKIYSHVFLESAEKMSLNDSSVNFIFSNCVIEHIPNAEAVLSEVSRVLKAGGSFLFTVPSDQFGEYLYLTYLFSRFKVSFMAQIYKKKRNNMLNQYHCLGIDEWTTKLSKYGLKLIKHAYYMNKRGLMLWDKMALEVYAKKLFSKQAEKRVFQKYKEEIVECYNYSKVIDSKGAGLLIHCLKSE